MKKQLIVAFSLLSFGISFAQITTSKLDGKIQGKEITATTKVKITYIPTNSVFETIPNKSGRFSLVNLNVGGPYKIDVYENDQIIFTESDVQLNLGENDLPTIILNENKEKVIESVVLNGKKAVTGGTNIGSQQINNLANVNRGIQDVTKLVPQSSNNSFAGTNFRYNNVTIDGSINNDAIGFSPSIGGKAGTSGMTGSSTRSNSISLDAIQDIQVFIAPYDVKLGNFLGGSVNAVTRSGSNNITGSIYTVGRNADITGPNNAGDGSKMPKDFKDYTLGGRVGFPVVKDKVFFFTNFEYSKRTDPVFYNAGEAGSLIDVATAQSIANFVKTKYGFNVGSYDNYTNEAQSSKFFNKLDWKLSDKHTLSIRNNMVISEATNLESDGANFRFSGIDYKQKNTSNSTVLELKSHFNDNLSNSFLASYSDIHDFRNPLSGNLNFPQVEIGYNGGTILLGNDREATVFNLKQKTFEITDNLTYKVGNHTLLFGTHNELYNINYGFVNALNGRVSYKSLADFFASAPTRVRGVYPADGSSRDELFNNPYAKFNVNLYSVYAQDEINVGNRLKITPGIRVDYTHLGNMPDLSSKVSNSPADPNYGTTYTYTPLSQITNKIFGKASVSPRLGFNYNVTEDKSVVLRGGSGIFTGRIPFAWLGYAFYNDGIGFYSYDKNNLTPAQSTAAGDPLSNNGLNGYHDAAPKIQVDLVDNKFKMPQMWRSSLDLDLNLSGYKFTLEGIYTKVLYDLEFQQVNKTDAPTYFSYDTNHQMPIYTTNINSAFSNAYLLSNTKQGYRYNVTAQISKNYSFGLNFFAAYTYGEAKDITNGIRNSMESNWQMNQSLTPNDPKLATSNFETKHRIVSTIGYGIKVSDMNRLSANVYFNAQSGSPFSWGFVNSTIANTGQAAGLAYIFKDDAEATKYFAVNAATGESVASQVAKYDAYIAAHPYLDSRRGNFTERNGDFTPWNIQADFRLMDEIKLSKTSGQSIQITFSIVNLTNLLNKQWGKSYFVPSTFNSTASVGLTKVGTIGGAGIDKADPTYNFVTPGTPYSIDQFESRYQMQLGLRYNF